MTAEDAINVFKEQFCGLEAYCEIHRDGLCLTDGCEVWWAIKALEQRKADVQPVVQCKDCKHNSLNRVSGNAFCDLGIGLSQLYDFCSYGERKDG